MLGSGVYSAAPSLSLFLRVENSATQQHKSACGSAKYTRQSTKPFSSSVYLLRVWMAAYPEEQSLARLSPGQPDDVCVCVRL